MRSKFALVVFLLVFAAPGIAVASHGGDHKLDTLFDALKHASGPDAAKAVEDDIWKVWRHSGDAAADKQLARALAQMEIGDYPDALETLDALIKRAPDFAEAWNTRATVYFIIGDFADSMSDIEKTLELEPRHFGALSGLGQIMARLGDRQAARKAFAAALRIDPFLPGAAAYLQSLGQKHAGQDI